MASSNRHWPSMFKSKACSPNNDMSNSSCHRTPYTPGDDKSTAPEPKPRWNPKPEQIRILEGIFNSGMVNPPREEIRKIRIQLQEYGQVGDANVFYWFQNRKSRSKHKLRHLLNANNNHQNSPTDNIKSPTDNNNIAAFSSVTDVVPNNSPTPSVNQAYFQAHNEPSTLLIPEPFFPPPVYHSAAQQQNLQLLSEIMGHGPSSKKYHHHQDKAIKIVHHQQQYPQFITFSHSPTPTTTVVPSPTLSSPANSQFQGVGGDAGGAPKSTVFINDVAFEVGVGPFNVREAFGDEAVLIQSFGHPVLTDDWGVTLHPLQHGASYYLV